ncbi:MAG TPA: lytic transglycosylase domain-containing protein [Aggregatilineales bacterium]|nr:lytic transglycosylase domain-containing protein [Aggregatilineales bacterium]
MLPGVEMMACTELAVPTDIMQHVVRVESSFNPYAIGVVGGRLVRQPRNLAEAVSTARMLEGKGYNFSLGIAQINRYNLASYGLDSYERAFEICPNVQAGSRILAECRDRAGGDWGKAFSCYYSGNFSTGFRHGYVQKVFDSWQGGANVAGGGNAIPLAADRVVHPRRTTRLASTVESLVMRRIQDASNTEVDARAAAQVQAQTQALIQAHGQGPMQAQALGHAQGPAPAPAPMPSTQPHPMHPTASRPHPVLLQPRGAPPLDPLMAQEPEAVPPAAPQQLLHQLATVDTTPAVGKPPPTVAIRDEAFVF